MEDLSGRELGPYRVVSPFGEGGMAAVYKAFQPGTERYVALKILPRHYSQDPAFRERFQQEAQIIARFQHPHILPVFDYGEQDGYAYLAMPLIAGGNLAGRLHGAPLDLRQVRAITAQIGDALDYAHTYGVIHRDVKPSNILIDERGNALLADFGIAKMVGDVANLTGTGQTVGTPAYMSPEQIKGEELDGRSDIYSLGIVLYEMVTGRTPFRAETPPALYVKHLLDPLPPPSALQPSLPEAVEKVILKSLAKDREERYTSAAEMAAAIKRAVDTDPQRTASVPAVLPPGMGGGYEETLHEETLQDEQAGAREPAVRRRAAGRSKGRTILWAAILLAAVTAAAFLTRAVLQRTPRPAGEEPATGPAVVQAPDSSLEEQGPGPAELRLVAGNQQLGEDAANSVAAGDLDGDGDLDVVLNTRVWLNDALGRFGEKSAAAGMQGVKEEIALLDADGDGDLDLVAAKNGPNELWLNDGRGGFAGSEQAVGDGISQAVAAGDVDGDTDLDLVISASDGHTLYLNDGGGAFRDSGQELGSSGVRAVALEDVDGDGDLDAFFADCTLYRNNGRGLFSFIADSPCDAADPVTLAMGDIDGDGDSDAVIGNATRHPNMVMLNDGRGNFSDSGQSLGTASTEQVILGDFDLDGDLDLYSGNSAELGADPADEVWLNDGRGGFSDSGLRVGSLETKGAAAVDVDGDGDLDIVAGTAGGPNQLYLNTLLPAGARRYVDGKSGENSGDCADPAAPCLTIHYATARARSGDEILIAVGEYVENVKLLEGKSVALRGGFERSGAQWVRSGGLTVIHGDEADSVIEIRAHSDTILEDLTVTGGMGQEDDTFGSGCGGLKIRNANVLLRRLRIVDNDAGPGDGGALCAAGDDGRISLTIEDTLIQGNRAANHGGALNLFNTSTKIVNSLIVDNKTASNLANVMALRGDDVSITNSTIAGNNPTGDQALLVFSTEQNGHNSAIRVHNSILWDNALNFQADPPCPACFEVSYSNVQGYSGGEKNINADPLFRRARQGDFRLAGDSPCIDAGSEEGAPPADMEGTLRDDRPDMGAYEFALP